MSAPRAGRRLALLLVLLVPAAANGVDAIEPASTAAGATAPSASNQAGPAGAAAAELATVLAALSRAAGVSIVVDEDVDAGALLGDDALAVGLASGLAGGMGEATVRARDGPGPGLSLQALNRRLAGRGAVAIAVSPTLWRIVRDPYALITLPPYELAAALPRPPLRDRAGSVWHPVTRVLGESPSVDTVPRQVANVYGTGARLFIRGIARNRYADSGEDVGLQWSGLPIPNFVADVTDLRLPAHEFSIRRGPDPRQQRGAPAYGGYVDLAPRDDGDQLSFRYGSDGSYGGEAALTLGEAGTAGGTVAASWVSERWSTPERGAEAAGRTGTLSAIGRATLGAVDLRLDALVVDAEAGPTSWLLRVPRPGSAALPVWDALTTELGAFRATARFGQGRRRYAFTGAYLRAEGTAGKASSTEVARARASDRRHGEASFAFQQDLGDRGAFGASLGYARSRDGTEVGNLLQLDSLQGFDESPPALRLSDPYAFGTSDFFASDLERRFGTLWGSYGGDVWSAYGSLRLEDLSDRRVDERRVRTFGDDGCEVTVDRAIRWFGLLLDPGDEPTCFDLAYHLTGYLERAPVTGQRRERYATVDLSLRRAFGRFAGLTGRLYNRERGPSLLPSGSPLIDDVRLPGERLRGAELAFDHDTAAVRQTVTVFLNTFRRDPGEDDPLPPWLPERIVGVEWDGAWRLARSHLLAWSLGYLSVDTIDGAARGAPERSGALSWEWRATDALTVGAVLSHTGRALDDRGSPELADRTGGNQLDLGLRYDGGRLGEFGVGLENATNERFLRTIYDASVTQSGVVPTQERRVLAWWRLAL